MSGYIGSKASVVTPGAERKKIFAITTTTTSLTGLVYTPGFVHVYHNGVRLVDGTDYTATNGTSITLTVAAQNGDEVVVISYATFQTSDTVSASAGGTFSNNISVTGSVTATSFSGDGSALTGIQAGAGLFKGENGETGDTTNGAGDIFRINEQTLNTNVTIDADENASATGPLAIASGVTLTVTSGGNLSIV